MVNDNIIATTPYPSKNRMSKTNCFISFSFGQNWFPHLSKIQDMLDTHMTKLDW